MNFVIKLSLIFFFSCVNDVFCCDAFERNVVTNLAEDEVTKYLLYAAHDAYTSMNFFEVIFRHLGYSTERKNTPFIPDSRLYKRIFEKYRKGEYLCEGQDSQVTKTIVLLQMHINESAYGFFHACNWHDNIQLIVGIVTKDHHLFDAIASDINEIAADFETKICDCKAIKHYFIQECVKKPDFSNFFVIFLLVSVVFIAILFRCLGSFIKVEKDESTTPT